MRRGLVERIADHERLRGCDGQRLDLPEHGARHDHAGRHAARLPHVAECGGHGATLEIHDLAPCQIDEPPPGRAAPLELRRRRVFVDARRGVHGRLRKPDAELAHVHPRAVALQQPTVETVGRDFIADPRRLLLR